MLKSASLALAVASAFSGCAIHQTVKPVENISEKQICVIENSAVRAGFLDAYRRALTAKGYLVRQLPPTATISDCSITSTYTANWRWDLALYMSFAEIKVFSNGALAGEAKYDAQGGGANMGKFIDAQKKVEELTDQLFPGKAQL